jgi:DNA-binding transcriptional MerR regulator
MDRHLSPAEVAQRFGVTIKALRLYERHGLLEPTRSINGATGVAWRSFGPDQIARLHQVLALKQLGLPLKRIGELLRGDADRLATVLALQEDALMRETRRTTKALALVKAARAKLAAGTALTIDDLADLTCQTALPKPSPEARALFQTIFARHFSEEERAQIIQNRDAIREDWEDLKPQLIAAMAAGDPASPLARDVVQRCRVINEKVVGTDGAFRERFRAFRDEITGDPSIAGMMAITPEMHTFIRMAVAAAK